MTASRTLSVPKSGLKVRGRVVPPRETPLPQQPPVPQELPIPVRLASIESVFHSAPIGLCTVDLDFRYICMNECFARMYGKSASDIVGRTVHEAFPSVASQIVAHYQAALQAQTIVEREITLLNPTKNPEPRPREVVYLRTAQPVRDPAGTIVGLSVALFDITERRQIEADLRAKTLRLEELTAKFAQLAREDHLTRLANRRTFDDILSLEVGRARRAHLPLALFFADIDHFKAFNDSYGHPAGDEALREVAQAINTAIRRPGDLAARIGGEEFAVMLPNTAAQGAALIAARAHAAVRALRFQHPGAPPSGVTISVGVAILEPAPFNGEDREALAASLIGAADKALYQAKAAGRDRIVFA